MPLDISALYCCSKLSAITLKEVCLLLCNNSLQKFWDPIIPESRYVSELVIREVLACKIQVQLSNTQLSVYKPVFVLSVMRAALTRGFNDAVGCWGLMQVKQFCLCLFFLCYWGARISRKIFFKNMSIKKEKKKKKDIFNLNNKEEWHTVCLSLVRCNRIFLSLLQQQDSVVELSPVNCLLAWVSPASFPSFQSAGNALCTPSSSAETLMWEESCELVSSVVQGFLWGRSQPRYPPAPGMETPVLWDFIWWSCGPGAGPQMPKSFWGAQPP